MTIKTLIVDDEPVALDILENYIQRLDTLALVGRFTSPSKAFQYLQTAPVDLLFLDINMPNLNGIELLRSLTHPPKVIFTTAYDDYAMLGYELNIIDYLLKPIAYPRFLKALNKVIQLDIMPIQNVTLNTPQEAPYIFVQADKKMTKVLLSDILYIESIGNYLKIHTKEKLITTYASLTYMEEKLPKKQFVRIHRSFIIALAQLTAYTATNVDIANQTLPISRNYKLRFLELVEANI